MCAGRENGTAHAVPPVGLAKANFIRPHAQATLLEDYMKIEINSGAAIAAAAAALLIAGTALTVPAFADDAKGHCMGANACKGKGACKTASNDCKGTNACKGKGFVEMTKEECGKVEGAKFEPAK